MTYLELIEALQGSGHDYLTQAEAQDFIGRAANDTAHAHLWPFRLTTAAASLRLGATITDLGPIAGVFCIARGYRPLEESSVEELLPRGGAEGLGLAGTATHFYVDEGKLWSFPLEDGTFAVRHYALGGWTEGGQTVTEDFDTPKWPVSYHDVVLLRARQFAFEETDELTEAAKQEARWRERIEEMRQVLIRDQAAGGKHIITTEAMY